MTTPQSTPRPIELLAPARNAATAIEAISHGADAVYIGPQGFGARAAAGNSTADIALAVEFAHRFGARIYATVNTIVFDNELQQVERLVRELYRAGVDALIVQDMGLLELDLPPIALHASTQCDTRTPQRAEFLESVGFSQIVLPRELSLSEIETIHNAVNVPLECFVHGALCVSYSGDCHAGAVIKGRSANRGECAQLCRLPYSLHCGDGRIVDSNRHFLSLRDLNRSAELLPMLKAGVSSFKIEGRLKDVAYVKNIVSHYNRLLNDIVAARPDLYCRSSFGRTTTTFTPAPEKSFNRGFTNYFLTTPHQNIASIYTPKSQGEIVGKVKRTTPTHIEASLTTTLANGDGLGFFNVKQEFEGFRLNRIDGNRLYPASKVNIAPGTTLYRNLDKEFDTQLSRPSATRIIDVDMTLRMAAADTLTLDATDSRGCAVTATIHLPSPQPALTDQSSQHQRTLSRLGDTIYRLRSLSDLAVDTFIPAATLTSLRRHTIDLLDSAARITYKHPKPLAPTSTPKPYPETSLTYHSNVANSAARSFYQRHGVTSIQPAIEAVPPAPDTPVTVMTTRYCLRRELGACLKQHGNSRLPEPLWLTNGTTRLDLQFDCTQCQMHVTTTSRRAKR